MRRKVLATLLGSAAGSVIQPGLASAQSYPTKPVRLVVPFPAGSATDNIARLLARELQGDLSQPLVVDNRPGAQGIVGAEAVARSGPDGYTLLVAAVSFAATPSLFRKVPFDPVADFITVSRLATTPLVMMVRSDLPVKTLTEFIDYAKGRRESLSGGYGSSSSQVCIAQLAALSGLSFVSVGYKGIPLAVNDLLAGAIQFAFVDLGNALAQAKGGKLRVLGVTSAKRSAIVSEWPALAETLPGYDIDAWIALLAPRGLVSDIGLTLHAALRRAMARPEVVEKLGAFGFTPALSAPEDSGGFLKNEVDKWARLSKQAGIEPE